MDTRRFKLEVSGAAGGAIGAVSAEYLVPEKAMAVMTLAHGAGANMDHAFMVSLVQFRLHTGRTHQIRVHMQALGHSIVCDDLYGDPKPIFLSSFKRNYKLSHNEEEERPILSRLGLHSALLRFTDSAGATHTFEAPLPKDMRALLQQLRKWKT